MSQANLIDLGGLYIKYLYFTVFLCVIGHKSFLSFFYLHYCYNNAVVHVFVNLMKESLTHSTEMFQDFQLKFYGVSSGK